MQPEIGQKIRSVCPDLLDWDDLEVQTVKDPGAPLSVVSSLGVIHAGVEEGSAVYRLRAGGRSLILKRHSDPVVLRREVANITFVNHAGRFAPEIHYADDATGAILMEDLGDESLAFLWNNQMMDEYVEWLYESVGIVVSVHSFYHREPGRLDALYGGPVPEREPCVPLPDGLVQSLDQILDVSRGCHLEARDRRFLQSAERKIRADVRRFDKEHNDFILDITPWHLIRKEGRIRVIDLTAPPIGSMLFHFEPAIWHLEQRREILESYLDRRAEEGLPMPDRNEFLYLEDALHALECVDWIGRYCRDILGGEQVLRGLDGGKLDDYAGDEAENLEAARRALECHEELSEVLDVLDKYFGLPLATQ